MRHQYIRGGQGFLIVYDVTNRDSIEHVHDIREMVLRIKDADKVPKRFFKY
jgi:GTPase SAR1 family protein